WEGTATELLALLDDKAPDSTKRARGWASSPKGLSNALRRVVPNLRSVGITVTFRREGKAGKRLVCLSDVPATPSSRSSEASALPVRADNDQDADDADDDAASWTAEFAWFPSLYDQRTDEDSQSGLMPEGQEVSADPVEPCGTCGHSVWWRSTHER